jgi:hypothetical protein
MVSDEEMIRNFVDHMPGINLQNVRDNHDLERYLLGVKAIDVLCVAEHAMIGSTTEEVDNPWIPYAILAGRSLEEVNRKREEKNLVGEFPVYPPYFGLAMREFRAWISHPSIDGQTLEVPTPSLVKVVSFPDWEEVDRSIWQDKVYVGPHARA